MFDITTTRFKRFAARIDLAMNRSAVKTVERKIKRREERIAKIDKKIAKGVSTRWNLLLHIRNTKKRCYTWLSAFFDRRANAASLRAERSIRKATERKASRDEKRMAKQTKVLAKLMHLQTIELPEKVAKM